MFICLKKYIQTVVAITIVLIVLYYCCLCAIRSDLIIKCEYHVSTLVRHTNHDIWIEPILNLQTFAETQILAENRQTHNDFDLSCVLPMHNLTGL